MAQRSVTTMIDDLTGKVLSEGSGETVTFSFDGAHYEMDVDAKSAKRFRAVLAPYVTAGRALDGRRRVARAQVVKPGTTKNAVVKTPPNPVAIRAWAASHGIKVSNRGRIPASVVAQFEGAGN